MAVAIRMKTEKYSSDEWKQFYESLILVFKIEKDLHEIEIKNEKDDDLDDIEDGQPRPSELFSIAKSEYLEIIKSIDLAETSLKSIQLSPSNSSRALSMHEEGYSAKQSPSQKVSIKSETKFNYSQ